jgi:di/tricarboxylate transporter
MTIEIALMLLLVGLGLVAFVRETFPMEVTALGMMASVFLLGFVDSRELFSGFSNKAVITIGALFVMGHALIHTGLLDAGAEWLGHRFARRPWLAVAGLLLSVALMSGFLNNTAVVAIFIPMVMSLCRRLQLSASKVLIPLSYASILGGTLTLIGTSTNVLVSSILEDAGLEPLGMFELGRFGVIILGCGLAYLLLFSSRLLPSRVEATAMTRKYGLGAYLTEVQVTEGSELVGTNFLEARLNTRYRTTVLAILRDDQRLIANIATMTLAPGDVLIVQAGVDDLMRLRKEQNLALIPDIQLTDEELSAGGLVMAEALVPPLSSMVGKSLQQVDFRERFGGFVLAIRRLSGTLRDQIAQARLKALDSLLMLIPESRLQELRDAEDLIVISELGHRFRRRRGWWLVLVLLPAVVLAATVGWLDIEVAAVLAVILLLLTGAVTPQHAYRSINWSVLFLIAAFVPVGLAIINTGTASFIADRLLAIRETVSPEIAPYLVLSLIYLATSVMTQMVSNNAAAIIVAPIALSVAEALGVDSRPFIVAVCFAASAEFMTPMGYQTNLMVYGPGGYRFLDYIRFGAPLNLLFWILATLLIPWIWGF